MPRKNRSNTTKDDAAETKGAATDKPARSRKPAAVIAASPTPQAQVIATESMPVTRATLPVIAPQARHSMVAEAAYYRAEKRGAGAGDPVQDWYEAEAEIEQMLEGMAVG